MVWYGILYKDELMMQCPKCNSTIVVLYGCREAVCEACDVIVPMKRTLSGTQYALVGNQITNEVVPDMHVEVRKAETLEDSITNSILENILEFSTTSTFKTLSAHQIKHALTIAYDLGRKNK